mgnify:CR=1 FL=1
MGFGANLNNFLKLKHMTVAQLAKTTGIPSSTLYAIIRRDSDNVNLSAVQKIADVLQVRIDDLMPPPKASNQVFADMLNMFSDDYIDTDNNIINIHFSTDEFTPDEIAEIAQFAEFIKQRKNTKNEKPPTTE